jgi:ABC-2 type transport system ATP-binding protein
MKINISNLSKVYRGSVTAISDMNIEIESGMFGLLGPNGAGKTTLMKILATLEPATSGTVTVGNYKLGKDDQSIRGILGYLPQEFGVYKKLTAEEYLDYIALMKGIDDGKQRKQEIAELLEKVNLTDKRKKKIGTYSGGMKQRIGIAQALLGDPKLIIVDEPTAGLDPEERLRFRNLLSELSVDRIVLLSTHIVADIESSCRKLGIMKKGRIVFHGTQEELLNKVKDRVWTGTVTDDELNTVKERHRVISTKRLLNEQEVRVIADEPPFAGAEQVKAGMEDGYMMVMGETAYA